jgi:hypothetical protein
MHLPSHRNHQELLASPGLVRFALSDGGDGPEATLLVKAATLELKYILRLKRLRLSLFRAAGGRIGYALQLDDDPDHPATAWSMFEFSDELAGALALTESPKCTVFLFNELAVNVAWGEVQFDLSESVAVELLKSAKLDPIRDYNDLQSEAHEFLNVLRTGQLAPAIGLQLDWAAVPDWHPIHSHFFTNQAQRGLISIFETNEGQQQEEIAHWLIDNLHPSGAFRNPNVHQESKVRELCDLLISYENGAFLFESKTLAVLVRPDIPRRDKLTAQIRKHGLPEAIRQLTGGLKNVRRGLRVTDTQGNDIAVEKDALPHIIVLVPDLTLLHDAKEFGGDFMRAKSLECKAVLHILDPAQLLRLVQAAGMIAKRSKIVTPLMAFDHLLMERAQRAWGLDTPDFDVIHRFAGEAESDGQHVQDDPEKT